MALFDGLLADAETKDEFGLTQADRRQPMWSGLIRAGLLGMGAGEQLMPQQRAQMLAQMGGAIADIPNEMMQYRAGAAQQALRGQQVAAGKTKIAAQERLRAYAASPEGKEMIAKLPKEAQFAAQAAIELGDADALQRAITGAHTADLRQQQLGITQQRATTAEEALRQTQANQAEQRRLEQERNDLAKLKTEQAQGQMTPAKAWAIVNKAAAAPDGDPIFASPEYKHAIDLLEQPTINTDPLGRKTEVPGLSFSHMPRPTFNRTGEPPKPRTPTVLPGQAEKPLPDNVLKGVAENLTGTTRVDNAMTELEANPNSVGQGAAQVLERIPPALVGSAGKDALDAWDPKGKRLRGLIDEISAMKVHDLSGAAVSVLEFPRLVRFIPRATDDAATVKWKLENFKEAYETELKLRFENIPEGTKVPPALRERYGPGGSAAKVEEGTYTTPDGKEISWADIEESAKAKRVTPRKVIADFSLKLKPKDK